MKRLLLSSFLLSVALFYFDASFAQESAPLGADRHGVKNVTCKECHGEKNEITAPDINQCSKCHAPDEIEKKTQGIKPSESTCIATLRQQIRVHALSSAACRSGKLLRTVPQF